MLYMHIYACNTCNITNIHPGSRSHRLHMQDFRMVSHVGLDHHFRRSQEIMREASSMCAYMSGQHEARVEVHEHFKKIAKNPGLSHFVSLRGFTLPMLAFMLGEAACTASSVYSAQPSRQESIFYNFDAATGLHTVSATTHMLKHFFCSIDIGTTGIELQDGSLIKVLPYKEEVSPVAVMFTLDTYFTPGACMFVSIQTYRIHKVTLTHIHTHLHMCVCVWQVLLMHHCSLQPIVPLWNGTDTHATQKHTIFLVCMCVCVCAYVYVCIRACVYVCMCAYVHKCIRA
jgi:hypothetical protein